MVRPEVGLVEEMPPEECGYSAVSASSCAVDVCRRLKSCPDQPIPRPDPTPPPRPMRSLLFAAALAALAAPAAAQSYVVTVDEARLFEQSDLSARVLATVPLDAVAELIGCRSSWCEVEHEGVRGYLRQRAITPTDRTPPRPSPSVAEPVAEPIAEARPRTAPPAAPAPPAPASAPEPAPMPAPPADPDPPAPAPEPPAEPTPTEPAPPTQHSDAPAPQTSPPATTSAPEPAPVPAPEPAPTATPAPAAPAEPAPTTQRAAPPPARPSAPPSHSRLKSPATGRVASLFLPGGGHFYAGESGRGTAFLALAVAAPTIGYLASDRSADPDCTPDPEATWICTDRTNFGPLLVGVAVGAAAWVASLLDAGGAAHRANERTATVHLEPTADARSAGLALRVTL